MKKRCRLETKDVFKACNSSIFEFETTEEVAPLEGIIGQERAVKAMEFGLNIKRCGYNIFMTGITGVGKSSFAKSIVKEKAKNEETPQDWVYVYNFETPEEPQALPLKAGMGGKFACDMDWLLKILKEQIPKILGSEEFEKQKAELIKGFQSIRSELIEELNKVADEQGFVLKKTGSGFVTVPIVEGKQLSQEEYENLEPSLREEYEKRSNQIHLKGIEVTRKIQNEERVLKEKIEQSEQQICLFAIGELFEELNEKYKNYQEVIKYLGSVKQDILDNLDNFKEDEEEQLPLAWLKKGSQEDTHIKYKVNQIVDNSQTIGAPVIFEINPTYYNLTGRVAYENKMGAATTNFTMIKAGAIHKANKGYLLLQAKDVLQNPDAWETLKRIIKNDEITIQNLGEQYGLIAMSTLKPQPIPLDIKIIMIGNPYIYQLLYGLDEDFKKLFKVKVDFDVEMDNSLENMTKMASFISSFCRKEDLMHFDKNAVARVVEYGSRIAGNQQKITTCFNDIVEVLYEADGWASLNEESLISEKYVKMAIAEKNYRSNKIEEKMKEQVEEGKILINTKGSVVGQVNGLSVIDSGDYVLGKAVRITANTFQGRGGVINIERESKMSGRIHDKGVLTLNGYFGSKYAQDAPLTLSASITFEQLYGGVEGDSASSTELFALLSSLSDLPIDQGIAVTGSVNQKGEIQPIGGVNYKVEGFYRLCKVKGLTGKQGVIIPKQNTKDLMLQEEVVKAIESKEFHIYAIESVEEGIEILTGTPFGEPNQNNEYPANSVNYLVEKKLQYYLNSPKKENKVKGGSD